MRSLRLALAAAGMLAATAFASPTDPKLGVDYVAIARPQPTATADKKVEVIEFFMYRCPHCAALEPELEVFAKKQANNIVLKRVHFPYGGPNDPGAHLHLTLEAMGKAEEYAQRVFDAIHKQHIRLDMDEQAIFKWVAANGIDQAKFREYWNSFTVQTKLKQLNRIVDNYKVETAPTIIIDGRYMTSPSVVGNANREQREPVLMKMTAQTLDSIVTKIKAEKK
ncbi:thiol:disulfide interchange protein DsbA/DsbL [Massilia arenosa]|uniref:Thiol:disulfide interchange protein n=1 Tax=Zemynaea arenosa TaxID=2561931 RepID=A0A4Y9S4H5_9BURK|nr:thiol:disulfide interchange protein DsbA/DsbL [Massilia arenosa]TFW14869.1 thiol:disulfide interchange protein DsbA/DsbL [Massilia arenosa]